MTLEELLAELRASRTDLARVVEAAARTRLPYIVVPARSVSAWQQREPQTWVKVSQWLTAQGIEVVRV